MSQAELKQLFTLVDIDQGGTIDAEEFEQMLKMDPIAENTAITFDAFYSSLLELLDVWDVGATEEAYADFLDSLFIRITVLMKYEQPLSPTSTEESPEEGQRLPVMNRRGRPNFRLADINKVNCVASMTSDGELPGWDAALTRAKSEIGRHAAQVLAAVDEAYGQYGGPAPWRTGNYHHELPPGQTAGPATEEQYDCEGGVKWRSAGRAGPEQPDAFRDQQRRRNTSRAAARPEPPGTPRTALRGEARARAAAARKQAIEAKRRELMQSPRGTAGVYHVAQQRQLPQPAPAARCVGA